MTCRACELRVEKALAAVPGIAAVRASARTGTARLTVSGPVSAARVRSALARAGYRPGRPRPWLSRDRAVWRDVAIALGAVAALLGLATVTGLADRLGSVGAGLGGGGLLVMVLLGLVAGFSTCMAMVGGLVLGISARSAQAADQQAPSTAARPAATKPGADSRVTSRSATDSSTTDSSATAGASVGRAGVVARMRPHLAFNAGRVVGFGVLGALTGLLGSAVAISGTVLAVLMLVVAVVMTLLGLQLTAISPRLSAGLLPTLPAGLTARLRRRGVDGATAVGLSTASPPAGSGTGARGYLGAAGLGAASFFLPCGFTQAVQLYALSTGSPATAAAMLALFALGTTPGLLGIGGVSAVARGQWGQRVFRMAGVVVLVLAAVNASGALRVLAPTWTTGVAATEITANVEVLDGVQVLRVTQQAAGYSPQTSVIYAGVPVRWEVTSEALTCAAWLVAPEMGASGDLLTPGEVTVFEFVADRPGTLTYSCGMGMYTATVHVIDQPDTPAT